MGVSTISKSEWQLILKLTKMHIKRMKANIIDSKNKNFNSEIRKERVISEMEKELSDLYLLEGKSELNLNS